MSVNTNQPPGYMCPPILNTSPISPKSWSKNHKKATKFLINVFLKLEDNYNIVIILPYINMNQLQVHMCPPHSETPSHLPPHPIPLGCPRAPALSALLHASNLHWSSILHVVIYMFQCYSLKSFHPRLLPQSPSVCSLYLSLFCCLAYRVIVIIFLNSIYVR